MSTPTENSGGAVAIRGYLVQTLVALLDIAQAHPPFTEITLEPAHAEDQFDFVWSTVDDTYAVQVKSTINEFQKSAVEGWAQKLQAVRKNEKCRLILVGNYHTSLAKVNQVDEVAIEKKNLDLLGLFAQAAHQVAKFLHAQNLDAGTPDEHEQVAENLVTRLLRHSTTREKLTREAFIQLLTRWIKDAQSRERKIDIDRIIKYAPAELIGREAETKLLADAWEHAVRGDKKRPHVLTFVALGGEGKTSLVAKWAAELAHQDWLGCDAVFAWSFYSQGTREQVAASSDLFLKEALTFFGDAELANSAQGAFDKGRRLAQLVGERRALLILDGLEPLQYAPTSPTPGELKDQGVAALLKGLAANNHGLGVVTTRYSLPDLRAYWQNTAPEHALRRLSTGAGVDLLQKLGVRKASGSPADFEKLVEDVQGHALTLNLLGGFLKRACHGDIRQRDRVKFKKADAKIQGGHAFRMMAAYEAWLLEGGDEGRREVAILRLMGLFDRPADAGCIAALRSAAIPNLNEPLVGLADDDWEFSLTGLESAKLLTVNRDKAGTLVSLDAHPLLREYFAKQLKLPRSASEGIAAEDDPSLARRASDVWRAAHQRLYEHLCETTKEGEQPTLEDLQPLYQAVAHGCQAELQQDTCDKVYFARIKRESEGYSTKKLGAFGSELGAIACFFENPWSRVSPALSEADQAWTLSQSAFYLRALGRLIEALEPMRSGIEGAVRLKDWKNAAIYSNNLSELELTLGELVGAVGDAEQSVTYADRSGNAFQRLIMRCTHANALHQAGRRAEARFREAEQMQAEIQPDYPLLYSLRGFQYCDLLLTEAERAAWQSVLASGGREPAGSPLRVAETRETPVGSRLPLALNLVESCRAVSERATKMLSWEKEGWLLDIAFDHLTLGRAALYQVILKESEISDFKSEIEQAVSGLRRAGQQYYLPFGLLTRTWLRSLTGARTGSESAQSDLDEAWGIAERGPMPLFLADIHLHRARLFGRRRDEGEMGGEGETKTAYPWVSVEHDLAEARWLILKHGYLRRMEELEDAEHALLSP